MLDTEENIVQKSLYPYNFSLKQTRISGKQLHGKKEDGPALAIVTLVPQGIARNLQGLLKPMIIQVKL